MLWVEVKARLSLAGETRVHALSEASLSRPVPKEGCLSLVLVWLYVALNTQSQFE